MPMPTLRPGRCGRCWSWSWSCGSGGRGRFHLAGVGSHTEEPPDPIALIRWQGFLTQDAHPVLVVVDGDLRRRSLLELADRVDGDAGAGLVAGQLGHVV